MLLNHHNCESAMALRRAKLEPNPVRRFVLASQARKQAVLEESLCAQVTVNAVVSALDGELLRRVSPSAHVHVVENGTDTDYFVPEPASIEPLSLVFAGSMNWYPNISGLRYFRERIWPRLKSAIPELKLFVAGFSPGPEMQQWAESEPALTLVANPDDIRPWIAKGAVFICPIIDGGGTRLKLLDAMSAGKAIVSTRIGAEGLGIEPGKHALIAESDSEFADLALKALRDPALRRSLSSNARRLVEERFSWQIIGRSLEAAYVCERGGAHV
jgi:glycosyltransferase involved in cell wall biosynthesis